MSALGYSRAFYDLLSQQHLATHFASDCKVHVVNLYWSIIRRAVTLKYIAVKTILIFRLFRDLIFATWPVHHSNFIIQKRHPDPPTLFIDAAISAFCPGEGEYPRAQYELPTTRWLRAIPGFAIWIILAYEDPQCHCKSLWLMNVPGMNLN